MFCYTGPVFENNNAFRGHMASTKLNQEGSGGNADFRLSTEVKSCWMYVMGLKRRVVHYGRHSNQSTAEY